MLVVFSLGSGGAYSVVHGDGEMVYATRRMHEHSIEMLHHFRCGERKKWWSIADAPQEKTEWWCPWCGERG